jgi:hypothetical protein
MPTGRIEVSEAEVEVVEGEGPDVTIEVVEQNVVISEAVVGLQGTSGDKHYQHVQATPSATWSITHNLGKRPSVTVVDSGGNEWITKVEHVSDNALVIRFTAPFSGNAYLN